jgi:hypothetical protein
MVLMYWREYRTQEHIGETYGLSKSTLSRRVQAFEDILIKDKRFHLPGKKAVRQSETIWEVVLLDATQCPCERPKKTGMLLLGQEETPPPKGPTPGRFKERAGDCNGLL